MDWADTKADKIIGYLQRTDALGSMAYVPAFKAEMSKALRDERAACAEIAQAHGEFCHKEAQNGGSPDLRERGNGATYIAGQIRDRS